MLCPTMLKLAWIVSPIEKALITTQIFCLLGLLPFFFYVSRGLIPFTMTMVFGGLRTQIQLIMSHLNERMYFWLLRERVYYFPYVWTKVGHDEAIFTLSCP